MSSSLSSVEPPLAWTSRPVAELLRLAGPISVSMLSYSVMTLVGTLFVAHLGPAPLAGVGLAGVTYFSLICFGIGLFGGAKTLMSQAIGARDENQARAYEATAVVVAAGLSAVLFAVGLGVTQVLPRFTATPDSGLYAQTYLRIRLFGIPAIMLFCALREGLYARGNSRGPMAASVLGNVTNLALDYLLIARLEYGVRGAAFAALVGQLTEVIPLAAAYLLRGGRISGVTLERVKTLLRIGGPSGIQFMLEFSSFGTVTLALASLSDLELSTHQIIIQVAQFGFLPAVAMGEAVAILCGQGVGAGRDDWVLRVAKRGLAAISCYSLVCSAVVILGNSTIAGFFTEDPRLISRVSRVLWVAAAFQVFDAAQTIARSALRGAGDVRFCALAGIICTWVVLPPLSWLLGVKLGLGALGGWLGIYTDVTAIMVLYWWRLRGLSWVRHARRLRDRMAAERASDLGVVPA